MSWQLAERRSRQSSVGSRQKEGVNESSVVSWQLAEKGEESGQLATVSWQKK